jgi:hypothetical protein
MQPEEWLYSQTKLYEDNKNNNLRLPLRDDGTYFTVKALYDDQKFVVAIVMEKLHEWMKCQDPSTYKPLRMTINGSGGCGKSVIINTLVTLIRRMCDCNDVVKVAAPTGTAAFNVGGETLHSLMKMGVDNKDYIANSLKETTRKKLVQDFRCLLALIIDERSLVNSKDLGTMEQMISETIFHGGTLSHLSFGGLPIVILVGDDYQLPATTSGAIDALTRVNNRKMEGIGRRVFLDCSKHVVELTASKRIHSNRQRDKDLISKVRIREELSEEEVSKLLSLHTDRIIQRHGAEVMHEIEEKAVYLFFRNEPRIRHNITMLHKCHDANRPVGFFKVQSRGAHGKAIASHFNSPAPETSIFCVGSKVAIDGKNFCPEWGLHNSACGIVDEIVFKKGENPNKGDLPLYTVVDFPAYKGPAWDTNNPTVRSIHNTSM